jgi:hypothetical protein
MTKTEQKKLLEQLSKTSYGVALKEFLNEEREGLLDVRNSATWEDALASKKAIKLIDRLFSFMIEKKETNKETNQYL